MITAQCLICDNYLGDLSCLAFPDKIPNIILFGKHDHTKPYKGDKGIRFEPIEEE